MNPAQTRETTSEVRNAHDRNSEFDLIARRDTLFAQQAAAVLDMSELAARELSTAALGVRHGPDHDDMLIRYMADVFTAHGRTNAADELSASLDACEQQARQQLGLPRQ